MVKPKHLVSMVDIERRPSPVQSDPLADIDLILSSIDSAGTEHRVVRNTDNQAGRARTAVLVHPSGSKQARQQSCESTNKKAENAFSESLEDSTHHQQRGTSSTNRSQILASKTPASERCRPAKQLSKHHACHPSSRPAPAMAYQRKGPKRKSTGTKRGSL